MKNQRRDLSDKKLNQLIEDLRKIPEQPAGDHLGDDKFVDYAMGQLLEEEVDHIDRHLAACDICAAEMERIVEGAEAWSGATGKKRLAAFRKRLAAKGKTSLKPFALLAHHLQFIFHRPALGYTFAAAILILALSGTLWSLGPIPMSQTASLAYLDDDDLAEELKQIRGEDALADEAYNGGMKLLHAAQQRRWLFFLAYDPSLSGEAVERLEYAYTNTSREFERAVIAFYLAKAHLMREDLDSTVHWLQEVIAQKANEKKRRQTDELLIEIEKILGEETASQTDPEKQQKNRELLDKIKVIQLSIDN